MKKVFIDGGANIGNSIDLFHSKYPNSSEFEIHSFEPNPQLWNKLREYEDRATLYQKALYKADTVLKFYLGSSLSSSIRKDKNSGNLRTTNPIQVKAIRLSSFIKTTFNKDDYIVLKLDIEGAEYDIIPDLLQEGLFDGWVNELYGEWHYNKLDNVTEEYHNNLVKELSKKGFTMNKWCAEKGEIYLAII